MLRGSSKGRRLTAAALSAGVAALVQAPAAGAASQGCESMSKNAGTKIEVCGFWDTRGSIGSQQISNFRFQVRNGSGGGFLELRPIAKWEPVRLPPETRRFSGTGYQLNHSATRTTQICWAASSLSVMDQRLGTPCGKVGFETSITFEAIRYDKSYREIDRLIHK